MLNERRKRVSVVHCVDHLSPGGAQFIVRMLVQYADRTRFAPIVYALRDGPIGDKIRAANVPVYVLSGRRSRFDPMLLTRLKRRLRTDRVDLIHAHLLGSRLYCCLASALTTWVPHVATIHGMADRFTWCERIGERWTLRHMTRVVAVSHAAQAALGLIDDRLKDKALVIPNGIDVAHVTAVSSRSAVREALGLTEKQIVLATVGRLHPIKGQTILLDGLALVVQKHPEAVLLVIGGGKLLRDLVAHCRRLGIAEHVCFLGERDDVSDLVAASDVFVLSSVSEAMPLALLEAMALGRACVATRVGGIPEIVTHGKNGLLAPAKDAQALAAWVTLLLEDAEIRQRLGEAARQTVMEHFDGRQMVAAYENLYAEVLADV